MDLAIFRIILLIISFLGLCIFANRYTDVSFSIGISVSFIVSILYIAGLVGYLKLGLAAVLGCGLLLLVFTLVKDKPLDALKKLIKPSFVYYILICAALFFVLKTAFFFRYDDFSHWAVASKIFLTKNRLINSTDPNVYFTTYPPGATLWIYYVCKAIGSSAENLQMWAMSICSAAFICPLFAFAKSWIQKISAAVVFVMLLVSNTVLQGLLVDTLMPLCCFAAIALCVYYKESINRKVWFVLPNLIFLVTMKTPGILYAVFVIAFAVFSSEKISDLLKQAAVLLGSCIAAFLLWQIRIKIVFPNDQSYHNVSLNVLLATGQEKSSELVFGVLRAVLSNIFSLSNGVIFIILFFALILELAVKTKAHHFDYIRKIAVFSFTVYVVYQVMLFCLYIFSMSPGEAEQLAAYDRYHQSILILLFTMALLAMFVLLSDVNISSAFSSVDIKKLKSFNCLLMAAMILFAQLSLNPNYGYFKIKDPWMTSRGPWINLMKWYSIEENVDNILLFDDEYAHMYDTEHGFISHYLIDSQRTKVLLLSELAADKSITDEFEQILVFGNSKELREYLKTEYNTEYNVIKLH